MEPTIRLLAFAGARDILGASSFEFPIARSCTAGELLAKLCERFPPLAPYRSSLRLAVNGSYAVAGDPVLAGDEVAIIPPVAGG